MYIDTHVHLTDDRFEDVAIKVKNYLDEGIEFVINAGYDLPSSIGGKVLAETYDSVYFAAGIHPSDAHKMTSGYLNEIEKLLTHKKAVALGEIGLDYHYDNLDIPKQKRVFLEQSELAYSLKMPIIIHSRDCTEDMVNIIRDNKKLFENAVMHCFSGSKETAKTFLDNGMYISFSGTITFKNSRNLGEVALYCPIDRILCETDCPYLSPEPFRGRMNEPKNVKYVYQKLAQFRNENIEELCLKIKQNTLKLFKNIAK